MSEMISPLSDIPEIRRLAIFQEGASFAAIKTESPV